MSQTERGWADPHAVEQGYQVTRQDLEVIARNLRREELRRQIDEPTEVELAAEEAQLP